MLSFRRSALYVATLGLVPAVVLGEVAVDANPGSAQLPVDNSPALRMLDEQRSKTFEAEAEQRLRQLQRQPGQSIGETVDPEAEDSACWPVSGLILTGNSLIDSAALASAATPSLSPCMSRNDVNGLLAALTGAYVKAGYITARPYLAYMPAAGDSLKIEMIEGFVESIEISEPGVAVSLAGAFPGMLGRPLYLPDLEQGLEQLNRLRANDFTVDIVAGSRTGASRLLLRQRHGGPRWRVLSLLNNSGSDTSGRHNGLLSVSVDSPLQINDLLALTYMHTLDGSPGSSKQASVFYQVPYGAWTLDASASDIKARSIIGAQRFVSTQTLQSYGLKLDRSLWRDQFTLLNASVRLDRKRSESRFFATRLAVSSATLTVVEAGLSFTRLGRSQWNGYIGYSQGLSWLDADERGNKPRSVQPRFEKYLASLSQTTWFALPGMPVQWRTDLNLQRSPDYLPDLEQLRLAGNSSVRGYRLDGQSMSSGAVLRNTLQAPQQLTRQLTLTPSFGLDAGWGRHSYGQRQTQNAVGASLGTSLGWSDGRLTLGYQRGLKRRANSGLEPGLWTIDLLHQF